jgi:hypothetical protein
MRKMNIDLSSPSLLRTLHRLPFWARALALAIAAIMPLISPCMRDYKDARHRYETQSTSARTGKRAEIAFKISSQRPRLSPEQAIAINAVIMRMSLPWPALHDAVQAATPPSVALLTLEPDAKRQMLRITAEATNSEDMFGYLESIKTQGWFTAAALLRHEVNEQDPNHPIRFQLDAEWTPR